MRFDDEELNQREAVDAAREPEAKDVDFRYPDKDWNVEQRSNWAREQNALEDRLTAELKAAIKDRK
jgi:hypothetical protein